MFDLDSAISILSMLIHVSYFLNIHLPVCCIYIHTYLYIFIFLLIVFFLQCFDTVGWVAERASGL